MARSDEQDEDYPTEEQLAALKAEAETFDAILCEHAMAMAKELWWMASWGWTEKFVIYPDGAESHVYEISTGGWSGNESIIEALENSMLWRMCWVESRRGGHYVIEIKKPRTDG